MADYKLATCLWFVNEAEEAANFYCDLFPDSEIMRIDQAPDDAPGDMAGQAMIVGFTLLGHAHMAMNGRREGDFTDAVSFQVFTETQEETDRYWDALTADGGSEMACSWCKDRFGVRWQIAPKVLMEGLGHPDPETRGRVFAAMERMIKIDHADIEAAIAG